MSKINTLEQSLADKVQEGVNKAGLVFMATAAMLGTVELAHAREKAIVPEVALATPFTNVREATPVTTDSTLRREKENEVGAHGAIYTVVARSQSRAGKQ